MSWQPCIILTLLPIRLLVITTPAPIVTLLPMIVGPWIVAVGSIEQFLPILTSREHENMWLRQGGENGLSLWPSVVSETASFSFQLSSTSCSWMRPHENTPNGELARKTCTQFSIERNDRRGTWKTRSP